MIIIGSVFISHSAKNPDYQVTKSLAGALEKSGFDVWWDEKRLELGNLFTVEILEAIIRQHFFIYIISPRSVASEWCARELTRATELGKDIMPLLLEKVPVGKQPLELAGLHYVSVSKGISESFPKILKVLGVGMRGEFQIAEDPFARDDRLVKTIANQLNYAPSFTNSLNLVQMLKSIGESCCQTDRARQLFADMLSHSHSGGRIDYNKVRLYLLNGWHSSGDE